MLGLGGNRPKFTDEELQFIMETREQGLTWSEVAERVNERFERDTTSKSLRNKFSKMNMAKRGWSPEHDMIKVVPEGYKVRGVSTYYGQDGQPKGQWVKSTEDKEEQQRLLEEMLIGMAKDLPHIDPTPNTRKTPYPSDIMSSYIFGDGHLGAHAWGEECGEDWDLQIAKKITTHGLLEMASAAPDSETGLIVNLGDWYHYDGMVPMTARSGHILDSDGRYAKMVRVGVYVLRFMIDHLLTKHKYVKVINAIGNHDQASSIFLNIALCHIYEKEKRVEIDVSPSVFNYVRFGKTLIGVHHTHSAKPDKLPGVMATDRAKDWGDTEHRYWLCGHVHTQKVTEYPGVIVESFRTLAARDEYAHSGGWRSKRSCTSIVYHKEFGEIQRHTIGVDLIERALADAGTETS